MPSDHKHHSSGGPMATIVANLRRAPKRVRRQGRDIIDTAVAQLFDAAVRAPAGAGSGQYRTDELARLAGTTTRNIRVYRDRGLLPPPRRAGRLAFFDDTHLTRLRLISSMLARGYTIANLRELLGALEDGKSLADLLGVPSTTPGTWAAEKPHLIALTEAQDIVADPPAFERLVALNLISVHGDTATVLRPNLLDAFAQIRDYGVSMNKLIDVHEQVLPHIEAISDILIRAGAEHAALRITPSTPLPDDAEISGLITTLIGFRTLAVAAVSGTLAASIESTIESMVGRMLSQFMHQPDPKQP
ncbi:MerR family transcriptional regulator [Mycobacterium sp. pUA109]|uniref:MerR family transcriptional regulator n=1 Tax=Mycobacterium sp. pUA109 TaxID=3238982 RepID=UPI00351AC01D